MEEEKEILTERVLSAIKNRNASELREIFETIPNIDIAECLDEVAKILSPRRKRYPFYA